MGHLQRAQHELVGWPHFQQFWQRGTPGLVQAACIMHDCPRTMMHFLMRCFARVPPWESQMLKNTSAAVLRGDSLIIRAFPEGLQSSLRGDLSKARPISLGCVRSDSLESLKNGTPAILR